MNKFKNLRRRLALLLAIFTMITSIPAYGDTTGTGGSEKYPDGVGSGDWIGEGPSDGSSGGGGGGSSKTTIKVTVDHNDNANTVIMDLAKFNVLGFPYELESMRKYLKEVPEYKYGDIIDFKEIPFNLSGRQYLEFEEPLVRDGVVRQLSDVYYNSSTESWTRQQNFTFNRDDKVEKTYFLASLARGAGIKDEVYLSSRSTATWVLNQGLRETKYIGRQKIEESPYQKEIQGQVDIGTSIVLIDYNNRDYSVVKLDNIYKPYISYLINIGVIDTAELRNTDNSVDFDYIDNKENSIYEMIRANYSSIPVSSFNRNTESSKDFEWEDTQVTLDSYGGSRLQFTQYDLTSSKNPNPNQQEYEVSGYLGATSYRLNAQVPEYMTDESMTVMDGLNYIYKYMWYKESEPILNDLEVDAVIALYGLRLTNYTQEEKDVLKYLIAKGIVNPQEDDLESMRKPLIYEDMLKYLFRLNYSDKRFDFKSVTLSSDDIRLAREGYSQDNITLRSNSDSIDTDLQLAKRDVLNKISELEKVTGYFKIFLKIPNEEYANSNFILSSSKDLEATFLISPMKVDGSVYGKALIPKTFNGSLILRSTSLESGYRVELENWIDGGIYEPDDRTGKFKLIGNYDITDTSAVVRMNRFAATDDSIVLLVDKEKEYTYNGKPLFEGESGSRVLNHNIDTSLFELHDDGLKIKGVYTIAEMEPILNRIDVPPGLSSDEFTFMGYSQITLNGEKITLIRDTDLSKMGIEIVEDNVLYNRKLDLYGYLDPRTSTLYYGNTIVRFKEGTLMLQGIKGAEATFYNLDIIKTMLTSLISNKGISHEVLTQLPPDESIQVLDTAGELYDYIYMHPNEKDNRGGDWWMNVSTLSKKNSNIIFFKNLNEDLNLLINFRARVIPESESKKNNNNFSILLSSLKSRTMNVHPGMNELFKSMMGYNSKFSIYDYNYGITILYDVGEEGVAKDRENFLREWSLNVIWNMLPTEKDRDAFIGSLHSDADFADVELPDKIRLALDTDTGEVTGVAHETFSDYYEYATELVANDLKKTLYLSTQKIEDIRLEKINTPISSELPAKIINNNLYLRYKNFEKFTDISDLGTNSPYRFLDSLIFLYKFDVNSKIFRMEYEKVNYENTPKGYIPLEDWERYKLAQINNWVYDGKVSLGLLNTRNEKGTLLFDKVTAMKSSDEDKTFEFEVDKEWKKVEFMEKLFSKMKSENSIMKSAWEHSEVNGMVTAGHANYEENLKTVLLSVITKEAGTGNDKIIKYISGETNKMPKGTLMFKTKWIYPSGTILVNVGNDYAGKLQDSNSYTLEVHPNPRPRTQLGNSFDLINQNISQLSSENSTVGEIPNGNVLVLPSGSKAYAIGDSKFVFGSSKSVGTGLDSESILLWNYLSEFNVRVGSSLILLNGIQEIKIPTREDITMTALEIYNDLALESTLKDKALSTKRGSGGPVVRTPDGVDKKSKLAFRDGTTVKTGNLITSKNEMIADNGFMDSNAKVFPILKLEPSLTVVKIMENEFDGGTYVIKDVTNSVDTGFVDYLREGIIDINMPTLEIVPEENAVEVSGSEVKSFKMKNVLIGFSKVLMTLRYALPMILFGFSVSCMVFLTLFAVPLTRNFLYNILSDKVTLILFKLFSLFSVEDMYDLNIPLGYIKSMILMVISIIWWKVSH